MANVTIPQPGVPYMKMWIGGAEVTFGQDRRLMSFTYDMAFDKPGNFTIEFVDTEWTYIEGLLHQYWNEGIKLQYGWLGSNNSKLWSDTIVMTANKFKPTVFDSYVNIIVDGWTKSPSIIDPVADAPQQFSHLVIKETSVAKILRSIFKDLGYKIGKIEDTAEFAKVHTDPHSTKAASPTFILKGQSAIQVFINEWSRRAVKPGEGKIAEEQIGLITGGKGRGGFSLYFIDSDPPEVGLTLDGEKSIVSTYDYPTQHHGAREVISFNYTADIMANTTLAQHSERMTSVEPYSGTVYTLLTSAETVENGPTSPIVRSPKINDGFTTASRTSVADGGNSRSTKEAMQYLQSSYWQKERQIRNSVLVLLGRPDYRLGHHIKMNVWMSKFTGGKSSPEPHYSSGIWMVNEVHQQIIPGEFTTTLNLKRVEGDGLDVTPHTVGKVSKYEYELFTKGDDAPLTNKTDPKKSYFDGD